jgi:hypothetical protein
VVMRYHDLFELCQKYGVQCDYLVREGTGSYRVYCWERTNAWSVKPFKVLDTLTLDRLRIMSRTELEDFVVSAAVVGTWS